MAQSPPRFESGMPLKPERGFPWRLWLYAVIITGAAGAGGYFAWTYRQNATRAEADQESCAKALGQLQKDTGDTTKGATDCKASLANETKKATDLEKQNADLAKNVNAT